jgi:hypothetical protein
MGKHYLYLNDSGFPEAIDCDTGEIVPMAVKPQDLGKYRMVTVEGQRRWVPLVDLPKPKVYSPLLADEVCAMVLEGQGIKEALSKVGLTYREYVQWKRLYPEFGEMVDEARKDRAELFFEKLEEVAETTGADEEEVGLGRLKADIYKHLAEVSDSSRFGKKTQITAKIGVGRIEVETGIRRAGDPGFTEARLLESIEEGQKQIEAQDLNIVPVMVPTNLPKKVTD